MQNSPSFSSQHTHTKEKTNWIHKIPCWLGNMYTSLVIFSPTESDFIGRGGEALSPLKLAHSPCLENKKSFLFSVTTSLRPMLLLLPFCGNGSCIVAQKGGDDTIFGTFRALQRHVL